MKFESFHTDSFTIFIDSVVILLYPHDNLEKLNVLSEVPEYPI